MYRLRLPRKINLHFIRNTSLQTLKEIDHNIKDCKTKKEVYEKIKNADQCFESLYLYSVRDYFVRNQRQILLGRWGHQDVIGKEYPW